MPPSAVKTIRDLIHWQYAKIISESAGPGKRQYGFVMDRFKKLASGEISWSTSIREYVKERERPEECIYCGGKKDLTVDHILPRSRGGPDSPDNAVWVCRGCNSSKVTSGFTSGMSWTDGTKYRGLLRESTSSCSMAYTSKWAPYT